mmetsp:Transcript_11968/g.26107  ORF Transcript_11968/g.26107 Transcript_11968/m.26107 type:complete len:258 (+) Transcript_11968:671-1444(+)
MRQRGVDRGPPRRLPLQARRHKVLRVVRHRLPLGVWKFHLVFGDFLERVGSVVRLERQSSGQHCVRHDSRRVQIHRRAVPLSRQNLRRHIKRRANKRLHVILGLAFRRLGVVGKPKVGEFDAQRERRVDAQDIFRFDVAVDDVPRVEVLDSFQDLAYCVRRVLLREVGRSIRNHLEQIAAFHVLHHHVQRLVVIKNIICSHDVRVHQFTHHVDFSPQKLELLRVRRAVHDFHCARFLCLEIFRLANFSIRTLSDQIA